MIEINLLPGSGRKAKRSAGGASFDLGARVAAIRDRVRDPWMIGAIAAWVVALGTVGYLYTSQEARASEVSESLERAVQDSTRYASVLREREKAEAKRDTVLRSLNLIRAIDDDRFIWPHVMDEVSRSLPPYTWLVSLGYSGSGQGNAPVSTLQKTDAPPPPPPAEGDTTKRAAPARKKNRLVTTVPRDTVRVRLVGNTVDIQALTRFMRDLEASPFLEQVTLAKSERANDNGKEVTQFSLDMLYSRPDPALVPRVDLGVATPRP